MADINRYLNVRSAYGASFAAETADILFLMNLTGVPQAWQMPRAGGWPDPLTLYDDRVMRVVAAPTGSWAVVGMDAGGNEREQLFGVSLTTRRTVALTDDARGSINTFGGFFGDGVRFAFGSNRRNGRDFDIYLGWVDGREPARLLLEREGTWRVAAVSPHDDALLLVHSRSNMIHVLHRLDLATGELSQLTPDPPARWLSPVWAGDRLLAVTDWGSDFLRLVSIDGEHPPEVLRERDWDVEAVAASRDGQLAAYTVDAAGFSELHLLDLATGRDWEPDGIPPGVMGQMVFSPDGLWLAVDHMGAQHTLNVWLVATGDPAPARPVTHASMAGFRAEDMRVPELVQCPSFDGRMVPAWYYRPAGGGPHPVVVSVHGGPESQERPGFNPIYQYLLAEGIGVLAPNVRGSTGYGKAYTALDNGRARLDTVKDLEAVAAWLRTQRDAEGDRLAVYGGSYGGYMVLMAVTHLPSVFQAAVDIVGMANLETFLENTGPWRRALREAEYGSLDDRVLLRELSPIHLADRIETPLMVIHGANDPRVPLGEAEQIVEAVRARGRAVTYMVFPDEGHGVVKLSNRRVLYPAIVEFLRGALGMGDGGAGE